MLGNQRLGGLLSHSTSDILQADLALIYVTCLETNSESLRKAFAALLNCRCTQDR